jgi:hypothetical protein
MNAMDNPALISGKTNPKAITIAYWIVTALFCLVAINLVSALIAHLSIHDRPAAFAPSSLTSVLWVLSYYFWRRLQAAPAN